MHPLFAPAICALLLFGNVASASFSVTNTADSGAGSLRQAIIDANDSPGADVIDFDIPSESCSAAGVCRIRLSSILPEITDEVLIDGTTQPRYGAAPSNVCATRLAPSYMRVQVEFMPGTNDDMLAVASSGASTIRGLSLLSRYVVAVRSAGAHHIACNHFGVDGPGETSPGGLDGVGIEGAAKGAIIGTNGDGVGDIGERNVFGGLSHGVFINANDDNWIAGNYFGFGADGVTPLGNIRGVYMRQGSDGNLVGTDDDGVSDEIERNLVGNSRTEGVRIEGYSGFSNEVIGNKIGMNAAGEPAGNNIGIDINMEIGGTDQLIQRNYIGSSTGSNGIGIRIQGAVTLALLSEGNCLVDNDIGFDHAGTEAVAFEDNWWGMYDGPSGIGAGGGDSVIESGTGTVRYTPWLDRQPESCLLPEPSPGLLGAAAVGTLATLRRWSREQREARLR